MPDFFVNEPDQTVFNLKGKEGYSKAVVDAIDVIDSLREARSKAAESGDETNWYPTFSKMLYDITGVKLSKTDSVLLIAECNKVFQSLKKNGSDDSEQLDTPTPELNTPSETS